MVQMTNTRSGVDERSWRPTCDLARRPEQGILRFAFRLGVGGVTQLAPLVKPVLESLWDISCCSSARSWYGPFTRPDSVALAHRHRCDPRSSQISLQTERFTATLSVCKDADRSCGQASMDDESISAARQPGSALSGCLHETV